MEKSKVHPIKVTLKFGGFDKEIELTLEEARELKEILNELLPDKTIPWTNPIQPISIEPYPVPRPWEQWQTWCDSQGNCEITRKV